MIKTIFVGLLLALMLPNVGLASIDSNLKYGQKSTEVSELQDFLNDKGFLTTSPTGFFGVLTLKAVKAYQASVGVPATGFVGSLTRAEINKELSTITVESDEAETAETGTVAPITNCSNGAVFNSMTGARCDGVVTTPQVVYATTTIIVEKQPIYQVPPLDCTPFPGGHNSVGEVTSWNVNAGCDRSAIPSGWKSELLTSVEKQCTGVGCKFVIRAFGSNGSKISNRISGTLVNKTFPEIAYDKAYSWNPLNRSNYVEFETIEFSVNKSSVEQQLTYTVTANGVDSGSIIAATKTATGNLIVEALEVATSTQE